MTEADQEFVLGFVPFVFLLAVSVAVVVWLWKPVKEVPASTKPVNLQEEFIGIGEKPAKEMSVELRTRAEAFKVKMAKKNKTPEEESENLLEAVAIFNSISAETGQPPAIHLDAGVNFADALLASLK